LLRIRNGVIMKNVQKLIDKITGEVARGVTGILPRP